MRSAVIAVIPLLFVCATGTARADAPVPLGRVTPPEGRFFDDAIAVSPDGRSVAAVATDAATHATLELWSPGDGTRTVLDGIPVGVTALAFLGPNRVLIVSKKDAEAQLVAQVAEVHTDKSGRTLTLAKTRLGPADAIDVIDHKGRRFVTLYSRVEKKTVEHQLQIVAADTLRSVARRSLTESSEGLVRGRAGEMRPLWWSHGHTRFAGQTIGGYDKEHDIRRPGRYAQIDLFDNTVVDEHEIEDAMAFAKVALTRKSGPPEEAYARLSEDRKEILLLDGLDERSLPLARDLNRYEPNSLHSLTLDDKTLLVGVQVDPNNVVAVGRRQQDPDDFDLYSVDRATMHGKATLSARRILTLPGQGRPVGFAASSGRLAILRKDKGFDRGGVAIELYALP
jgi:hypothetical protein